MIRTGAGGDKFRLSRGCLKSQLRDIRGVGVGGGGRAALIRESDYGI